MERIVGGCAETMQLTLYKGSQLINSLNVDEASLSNYKFSKGMYVHIDDNPETFFKTKIDAMKVGDRCLVSINGIEHHGLIRYVGGFHRKSGINGFFTI